MVARVGGDVMVIFINNKREIKDVGTTTDTSLTPITVDDDLFYNWTVAKICCYAVYLTSDNQVCGFYPYVDSRLIEHIDQLGKQVEAVTPYMDSQRAYIGDSLVIFENVKGTHVTAYCETDNGLSVPTIVERAGNTVKVFFETLEEVATVTISSI